eukprot:8600434-Pyramimonas_sp.AAC.1
MGLPWAARSTIMHDGRGISLLRVPPFPVACFAIPWGVFHHSLWGIRVDCPFGARPQQLVGGPFCGPNDARYRIGV